MSRLLGPHLVKSCRVWGWFVPKTFQGLIFLFSGSLTWWIAFWVICPWNKFEEKAQCTANIINVIFTVFTCVPISNVIPLYGLHLITAPCTVEKCKHWFTVVYCNNYTCTLYLLRQIFVIFTVFTCVPFSTIHIYLQCVSRVRAKWSGPFFWVREFFEYHP